MDHLALTVEGDRQRMTDRLFLDDLHVGQRFTSTSHVVDTEQIKRFAAEFDPQPFHLDEDAAANSMFAGLAASGWHTAALTMRLLVTGGVPVAGGIVGAGAEIAFPRLKLTRFSGAPHTFAGGFPHGQNPPALLA